MTHYLLIQKVLAFCMKGAGHTNNSPYYFRTGFGQDSHAFAMDNEIERSLVLGGVVFNDGTPPLIGNSDADVVLHALTNAISGITCVNVLGEPADEMCRKGITNSKAYVYEALRSMPDNADIIHVSFSIECSRPRITPRIRDMRTAIAGILNAPESGIGITATTGEGLTPFGMGLGIQVFCIITCKFT